MGAVALGGSGPFNFHDSTHPCCQRCECLTRFSRSSQQIYQICWSLSASDFYFVWCLQEKNLKSWKTDGKSHEFSYLSYYLEVGTPYTSSWELFHVFLCSPGEHDLIWLILLGWVVQPSTRFNWDFMINFHGMEQVPGHGLTSGMTCSASWNPHFHVVRGSGLLSGLKNHTVAVGMKVRFFLTSILAKIHFLFFFCMLLG